MQQYVTYVEKDKNRRAVRELSLYCKKILLFVFDSSITTKSHF